jgi:hypothetical protein
MSAFTPAQLGRFVQLDSGAHRLQFLWHFDSDAAHCSPYAKESLNILARILTSTRAGTNGLHSGRKDWDIDDQSLHWIDQRRANAEVLLFTSRFSLLSFTLELTEEGMKHNQEIVERVMGFIKYKLLERAAERQLASRRGFSKHHWFEPESVKGEDRMDEQQKAAALRQAEEEAKAGRFSPRRLLRITKASLPLVQRLSRALHVFPPERVVASRPSDWIAQRLWSISLVCSTIRRACACISPRGSLLQTPKMQAFRCLWSTGVDSSTSMSRCLARW